MIDYAESVIRDCEAYEDRMFARAVDVERKTQELLDCGEWDAIAERLSTEQVSDLVFLVWTHKADNRLSRAMELIRRVAEDIAEERANV